LLTWHAARKAETLWTIRETPQKSIKKYLFKLDLIQVVDWSYYSASRCMSTYLLTYLCIPRSEYRRLVIRRVRCQRIDGQRSRAEISRPRDYAEAPTHQQVSGEYGNTTCIGARKVE